MFELSTILAPLDAGSGGAVLSFADYLARTYRARLHSTHVVPEMPAVMQRVLFPYAALGEDVTDLEAELLEAAKRELEASLNGQISGGAHPSSVLYGPVVERVLEAIGRIGPDLLVMGAQGDDGAPHRHVGSTTARLLERWSGPAVVVRSTAANDRPFGRVAVALDFGPTAPALMTAALGLALRTENPLTVISVLADPRLHDGGRLLRGALRVDERSLRSKGERNAQQQFKRLMDAIEIPFPDRAPLDELDIELEVRFGDPCDEVADFIGGKDDTLLVIGRRSTPGTDSMALGRTAEQVVRRVTGDVLVAPVD